MNETNGSEILTLDEMRERYWGEWLLVAYPKLDEDLEIIEGAVLVHSPDRGIVYEAMENTEKGKSLAIEYLGDMPEAVILAL